MPGLNMPRIRGAEEGRDFSPDCGENRPTGLTESARARELGPSAPPERDGRLGSELALLLFFTFRLRLGLRDFGRVFARGGGGGFGSFPSATAAAALTKLSRSVSRSIKRPTYGRAA